MHVYIYMCVCMNSPQSLLLQLHCRRRLITRQHPGHRHLTLRRVRDTYHHHGLDLDFGEESGENAMFLGIELDF